MERESFIFYRSFYEAIKELPRDIQGEVLTAIMEYGLNGATTGSLKPIARAIVTLIKPQLEANNKRFKNSKKGGNPNFVKGKPNPYYNDNRDNQKITETLPKDNQKITEALPNVNDNVNDNVNVNVNDNVVLSSPKKFNFKKKLIDYGFEKELVEEWLTIRKLKKGINSEKAFNDFISEVEKTGEDKNHILKFITHGSRQWCGFNANWYTNEMKKNNKNEKNELEKDLKNQSNHGMHNPNRIKKGV